MPAKEPFKFTKWETAGCFGVLRESKVWGEVAEWREAEWRSYDYDAPGDEAVRSWAVKSIRNLVPKLRQLVLDDFAPRVDFVELAKAVLFGTESFTCSMSTHDVCQVQETVRKVQESN
jgi:hypothetical protein